MRWYGTITLTLFLTGPILGQAPNQQPTPLDASGKLVEDARASYGRIVDYTGVFYKQERVNGQLLPEQKIEIRVRNQPFSVYMKWFGPPKMLGQEACFVAGKNNNMMRAKASTGLASMVGFVSIAPNDPRAMATNRHAITESGIGHLIERLAHSYEADRKAPQDQVTFNFAEYRFMQKPCIRFEAVRHVNNAQAYCQRSVVYFDKENKLPIRCESYDWPKPGTTQGDLLECYSYVDLKFNVGLTERAFDY